MQAVLGGRCEQVDIEVIENEAPVRIVERNTGAGGRRVATGTYTLDLLPDGRNRITFRYAFELIPLRERVMREALDIAMQYDAPSSCTPAVWNPSPTPRPDQDADRPADHRRFW